MLTIKKVANLSLVLVIFILISVARDGMKSPIKSPDRQAALRTVKRIGVPILFSEVSATQAKESFSVMLASGNLPDIIEYNWLDGVSGGPENALKDGYILRLNELIDRHAPNLKKYLQEHLDIDKLEKTDTETIMHFRFLKKAA